MDIYPVGDCCANTLGIMPAPVLMLIIEILYASIQCLGCISHTSIEAKCLAIVGCEFAPYCPQDVRQHRCIL